MRRPNLDNLPDMQLLPYGYRIEVCDKKNTDQRDRLASLLEAAFEDASWTPEKAETALLFNEGVKQTFLIFDGDEIVATASVRLLPIEFPDSGYLHWVASSPEYKGKGLGYSATVAALNAFRDLGCKDTVLETQDHRLPAIQTYLKLGFAPEYIQPSHQARWDIILEQLRDYRRKAEGEKI